MILELNDSVEFYVLSLANLLTLIAVIISTLIYRRIKNRTIIYFIFTWIFIFLTDWLQSLSYLYLSIPMFIFYKLFTLPTLLFLILASDSLVRYEINPWKLGIFGIYFGGVLSCVFDSSNMRFYELPNGDITIDSIGPLEFWSVFFSLALSVFLLHQTIRLYRHSSKESKSYASLNVIGAILIAIIPLFLYVLGWNRIIPGIVFFCIGAGALLISLSYYLQPDMVKVLAAISTDVNLKHFEKMQHQIKDMESKLAERNKQLIRAQKMESMGTLATGIAHDFNNVLQAILGNAEIALHDPTISTDGKESIKEILIASEKGTKIARQILTFSRKSEETFEQFEVVSEINQMLDMIRRTFPKNIAIKVNPLDSPAIIQGNKTQLQQAIMNLVINSRDAMPQGGEIIISYSLQNLTSVDCTFRPPLKPGHHVQISVRDTGTGMDEEILNHLFEPFYSTKVVGKGTGLGLFMVYNMINNHNGFIQCYSEKGKGTEFKILIPMVSDKQDIIIHEVQQNQQTISNLRGSETILIIDDDQKILKNAQHILEEYGYHTLIADNTKKGLEIWNQSVRDNRSEIKLFLLDISIPESGAKYFLSNLKQKYLNESPKILPKVILTTGFTNKYTLKEFDSLNVQTIILKPFRALDLLLEIRKVLDFKEN